MKSSGRSSLTTAIWVTVAIVVALVLIVVVKLNSASTSKSAASGVASPALLAKITSLDTSLFTKVGEGTANKVPAALADGTDYTKNGKPAVLYIGAEYCPYCATERWPVVVALSRFGTFTGLGTTSSSATDAYPSTATFSFHGATYKSDYLDFSGVEESTNQPSASGSGYTPLDTPTAEQTSILSKYDAAPYVDSTQAGSIPFIYFGGKYVMVGSGYDPSILSGKTQDQIADQLKDPNSAIAKGVLGASNVITATLCKLTDNKPANVCQVSAITSIQAKLGS